MAPGEPADLCVVSRSPVDLLAGEAPKVRATFVAAPCRAHLPELSDQARRPAWSARNPLLSVPSRRPRVPFRTLFRVSGGSMDLKAGSRWTSAVSDVEVVVVKAPAGELSLTCGGHEMLPLGGEGTGGAVEAGQDAAILGGQALQRRGR